jgi:hypothetical protein
MFMITKIPLTLGPFGGGRTKKNYSRAASITYHIFGSKRNHLSPETIEHWYYLWDSGGIRTLAPKTRCDKNQTKLSEPIKIALTFGIL